jgi:hypothetical protein
MENLTKSIYNQHKPLQERCEEDGIGERSLQDLVFSYCLEFWESSLLPLWHKLVTLGSLAGNSICVAWSEVTTNNRKLVGLVMMAMGALMYEAHQLFDPNVMLKGFYYHNPYFWFYTQREEFLVIFGGTGYFLIEPQKYAFKYVLVFAVSFMITEVIYQHFFIDSWDDFYVTPDWQYWVLNPVLVLCLYKIIDYAVYRKYHLKDGNTARIRGIIALPNVDPETKIKHLVKLIEEQENFNARV